jgi:hypothetical protein
MLRIHQRPSRACTRSPGPVAWIEARTRGIAPHRSAKWLPASRERRLAETGGEESVMSERLADDLAL